MSVMGQLGAERDKFHGHTRSMCLWLRPLAVARLTFISFTLASAESILIVSYPINMLFAKQPFRPDQQESQCECVRKPDFQSGEIHADAHRFGQWRVQKLRDIYLRQFFRGADNEAADDRARHRLEASENQHRQRLERGEGERELHALAR